MYIDMRRALLAYLGHKDSDDLVLVKINCTLVKKYLLFQFLSNIIYLILQFRLFDMALRCCLLLKILLFNSKETVHFFFICGGINTYSGDLITVFYEKLLSVHLCDTIPRTSLFSENLIHNLQNKEFRQVVAVLIKTQRQRSGWSKPVRSCRPTELSGLGDFLMGAYYPKCVYHFEILNILIKLYKILNA
ncbi:hypothetical protein BpHYR1_007162 [Brachionus plicatilis]|uniref:Uncharacterized protein n=1 Tax=Brachionus plicatilis TaxID=10195 RepID=A0A3M7S6H1_BRAPC|nr:hypothetical protein BpHYR1_007162 [Brachionus plicatilis]